MSILITGCSVLQVAADGPEVRLLHDHDVLIEGQRIRAVQPAGSADPSQFDEVIRAQGKLVMPGLINTHAHVPMVLFRGLAEDVSIDRWFNDYIWALEHNLEPDDVYLGMQLGLAESIRGGVTTTADHYFHMDLGARAVEESGARVVMAWAVFGSQGIEAVERSAAFARDYQGAASGRITTMLGPHATYTCDDDFLRASADAAARLGVRVHIHAAETRDQTQASLVKRGQTPIQVLEATGILQAGALIAHACGVLAHDVELMAAHGAGVAYAVKTHLKLSMGHTPIRALRSAGVPVGLATDGAASNNTLDVWEALRLLALIQKEHATPETMPIPEALVVATRDSARTLGMADRIGAVEPGYLADVILLDLDGLHHQPLHSVSASLVFNTLASDVQTVIIDGRVVMRDRVLLTLDEGAIRANVAGSMARLARRQSGQRIQSYNP
jgi:5-methylthioadenosine/S-adenosylhomocysteine deaminase